MLARPVARQPVALWISQFGGIITMATRRTRNTTADATMIVFGKPARVDKLQAAWFRATQANRARVAAERHGLTIIPVNSAETRAIATSLTEGTLKVGGRLTLSDIDE